jgi:hypothetical protein
VDSAQLNQLKLLIIPECIFGAKLLSTIQNVDAEILSGRTFLEVRTIHTWHHRNWHMQESETTRTVRAEQEDEGAKASN